MDERNHVAKIILFSVSLDVRRSESGQDGIVSFNNEITHQDKVGKFIKCV